VLVQIQPLAYSSFISLVFLMSNVIFLVLFCALFLVSNILELVVFNEEILLTFCFITFIFCAYHYLRNTVQDALDLQREGVKNSYFKALTSLFDFILLENYRLAFVIKLKQKLAVYELLHKYYAFFTVALVTNEAIILNSINAFKVGLNSNVEMKKRQIIDLLLAEFFFNLVYIVLQLKYSSTKKIIFKKNVNKINSNLALLP